MANLRFTSSNIWRSCWFSISGGLWEYFTTLFEILAVENMGRPYPYIHLRRSRDVFVPSFVLSFLTLASVRFGQLFR